MDKDQIRILNNFRYYIKHEQFDDLINLANENNFLEKYMNEALLKIAQKGDIELFRSFLTKYPEHLQTPHILNGLFRMSCENGHIEIVQLINEDYPVDYQNAFVAACSSGKIEILDYIQKIAESSSETIDINYGTDLSYRKVCKLGHINVLKYIEQLAIKSGKEIDWRANHDEGIIDACRMGHIDIIRFIKSRLDSQDIEDWRFMQEPFDLACQSGKIEIIKEMISWKFPFQLNVGFQCGLHGVRDFLETLEVKYRLLPSWEEIECPICKDRKVVKKTYCNHHFCQECIFAWLQKNSTCPYCRHYIPKEYIVPE